jgi:rSAM/selenodomain-associated transferase 1
MAIQLSSVNCIIVFVKAPVLGMVKTRLAQRLADHVVVALYRSFVLDTLKTVACCNQPVRVFFTPPGARSELQQWLGGRLDYCAQEGEGLGEKMAAAFETSFAAGYRRVVLIGTDFPDLPSRIVADALDTLRSKDVVLGPANDGGYYLIGLNLDTFSPDLFRGIAWSTDQVFDLTVSRCRDAGLTVHTLPQWRDVDTFEDLADLAVSLSEDRTRAVHTFDYMQSIGLVRR